MSLRCVQLLVLLLLVSISSPAFSATPKIQVSNGSEDHLATGPVLAGRSLSDSLLVLGPWGSGAAYNGQFQDQLGNPDWNGWTHRDRTVDEEGNHWHAHSYHAEGLAGHGPGNLAAWCGTLRFPACEDDVVGGYGNYWGDSMVWIQEVADPSAPSVVTLDAWINLDLEEAYDFLSLELRVSEETNGFIVIGQYDGQWLNQHQDWEINIPAGEYFGPGGNQVELRFIVQSDGAYSDEDCLYPTAGACQIDDITVHLDNGDLTTFDDFEDGTLGSWIAPEILGSGDFSQLRTDLSDLDDCRQNDSSQVCFIDDGIVVPGTGGTHCISWCYGPGGFIVNCTGGLILGSHIENGILSPVMPWPEHHDGGLLEYDAYVHETLTADSPIILSRWAVRSVTGPDPEAITEASWQSYGLHISGGPKYQRQFGDFSPLLVPDATFVQVQIVVGDYSIWGPPLDGTPAPYFDNVRVSAVETYGPMVRLFDEDLANDSFPASGVLDPENLSSNSVRFDSGVSTTSSPHDFSARDYIQAVISTRGEGTDIGIPTMHYRLIPNPVFDPVRTSGLPNSGTIFGATRRDTSAYRFDLPDTGFFYPGDVIHYYFKASQQTPDGWETVMVPADTSGFSRNPWGANSQLPGICAYDQMFSVRALPAMSEGGYHPQILIWDDACDPYFTSSLRHDINQAQAWTLHDGFDLYRKVSVDGGRSLAWDATPEILAGYKAVFYFSGSNKKGILGTSDDSARADLALLTQWLQGNDARGLFVNGDHVLAKLNESPEGQFILEDYLGADFVVENIRPMIANISNPRVLSTGPGPYSLGDIEEWIVTGYCPDSRLISAVEPRENAIRLAEFTNLSGQGGLFPYSAMMVNEGPNQSICFSMPYDFRRIQSLSGWDGGGVSLRSRILMGVSSFFYGMGFPVVDMTPVPDRMMLSAAAYPNPFNPSTTISFNLPRSGHLNLKIFNVRGELVRNLVDEPREAGPGRIVWSGQTQSGGSASSGVYFYELRFGNEVLSEKIMLIK